MAEITQLSELRRKQKKKRARRGALLIVLVLVATLALSLLYRSRSDYGLSSFADLFQSGSGFPVQAPGGKNLGMYNVDGLLTVVTDTDLTMYNQKGGVSYQVKHKMTRPQADIRGELLLLFDQGSHSYTLYQKNQALVDAQTEEALYTGAVSARGTFALATHSEDYLSQVTVYDRSGRVQYSWNYADKLVSALALSPSGDKLAVCGLFTEEGTLKTQLLLYDQGQLVDSRNFDNAIICDLLFLGETQLRGISDQEAFLISDKGRVMGEYDFKSQPLAAYSLTAESTVLLLGDHRQEGGYQLVSLTSDMTRRSSTEIQGNIHSLKADGSNAYILAGSHYYQVDLATGEHLVEEESDYWFDLQPIGKGLFAMTNEEILRLTPVKPEQRAVESDLPEEEPALDPEPLPAPEPEPEEPAEEEPELPGGTPADEPGL